MALLLSLLGYYMCKNPTKAKSILSCVHACRINVGLGRMHSSVAYVQILRSQRGTIFSASNHLSHYSVQLHLQVNVGVSLCIEVSALDSGCFLSERSLLKDFFEFVLPSSHSSHALTHMQVWDMFGDRVLPDFAVFGLPRLS